MTTISAIRKGYSDGPFGQIHWRVAGKRTDKPDLYCLHPAPFSGLAYTSMMPHLAKDRRVFAPDYPGYGGSDAFKAEPSIAEYAEAMAAVIREQSGDGPVDLTGFHTGTLVATELAITEPALIGRLALVDLPAFDAETSAKYLAATSKDFEITPEMGCLEVPWDRGMTKRLESQSADRSFEMFTEQLRHGKLMNKAFYAAFTYDVDGRLPMITHPTAIIASQSGLLEASRRAATLIPSATLIERLDIVRAVLDESAEAAASEVLEFLEGA